MQVFVSAFFLLPSKLFTRMYTFLYNVRITLSFPFTSQQNNVTFTKGKDVHIFLQRFTLPRCIVCWMMAIDIWIILNCDVKQQNSERAFSKLWFYKLFINAEWSLWILSIYIFKIICIHLFSLRSVHLFLLDFNRDINYLSLAKISPKQFLYFFQ